MSSFSAPSLPRTCGAHDDQSCDSKVTPSLNQLAGIVHNSTCQLPNEPMAAADDIIRENELELAGFAAGSVTDFSPVLERVLEDMRRTGVACYSWSHLKLLLLAKLRAALAQLPPADRRHDERCASITQLLDTFEGPPFTLQRLTEVILEPQKSYKSTHKLINALEKLLAVSSTVQVVDPRSAQLLHQQYDLKSPENEAAPAPIAVVLNGAASLDPVARAPWGGNS